MAVSLMQIAASYDRPYGTTYRHIKDLIKGGLFVKKSPGKRYDMQEVKELEKLMHFKYRNQN